MNQYNLRALPFGLLGLSMTALLASSCSQSAGQGTGQLSVLLESEDLVVDGISAGEDVENIRDGWSVQFDQYAIALGDIDVHLATDDEVVAEDGEIFVVDLTEVPTAGLPLWQLDELSEGRWEFHYSTRGAGDGAIRHASVSETEFALMVDEDWSYSVRGTMSKPEGQSCPPAALATPGDLTPNGNVVGGNACYSADEISFAFGANAEATYGPCEVDDLPGFAVSADETQTVAATIHGDHLFFNGFPEGDEGGVIRLAQWLADCDLNLDGTVTQQELSAISPAQIPAIDDRYQLGGSPITPLDNLYQYVTAQLLTQGHFQGEGECAVNGEAHDH